MSFLLVRMKQFIVTFFESMMSCSAVMVQGKLSSLTWGHFLVAGRVGLITAACYVVSALFIKKDPLSVWVAALMTAVLTTVSDFFVHPTHFGDWWTEAVVTGLGAGALCLFFAFFIHKNKT